MSYNLNFWKESEKVSLDAQSIYERLSDGEYIGGVATLPIAEIAFAVEATFNDGWIQESSTCWRHLERGAFEVTLTDQLFRVDCYDMSVEDMNKFIDIGSMFGCPLHDPQVNQRFPGE
jgi:hypothetical protein